ncbi:two pore domain potassium channel family protein [Thalassotalea sp. G2M2-11]|uniref:two pore domain potassium channel family protein n=1 Tax=Thalassotalea sp. G2M2-11 TaxID=2787627 RepID=UPI0019CFCB19|nr:two pore domain potassium channel family protein [Thalassotalea sp. G2M2-11]
MKESLKTYTIDEFGVKNYNSFYLLIITVAVLYGIIALLSVPLFHFEQVAENGNILTYRDAFWTLQMSASTIGFGDYYPVTLEGRIIVAAMFYIGVGMVGFVGAQFVNKFVGFSDTNVKNRELRKQNRDLLAHNIKLEQKIDLLVEKIERIVEKESK